MRIGRREARILLRDNLKWPATLINVPRDQWPSSMLSVEGGKPHLAVYRNQNFLVQAFDEGAGIVRLSVSRTEWDVAKQRWREGITWDDLQQLKAEAGYAAYCAVEIYPADSDIVNVANMRHLFVLPEPPPFAWTKECAR